MTVTVKAGPPLHHAHLLPPLPQAFRKEKKRTSGEGKYPTFLTHCIKRKGKNLAGNFGEKEEGNSVLIYDILSVHWEGSKNRHTEHCGG